MTSEDQGKRMAELVLEIHDVEKAKREVTKTYSQRLAALWDELDKLAIDRRDGQLTIGDAIESAATTIAETVSQGGIDSMTFHVEGAEPVTITKEDAKYFAAGKRERKPR